MISFCMMVRDESENLPRCLDSIKDVADEIVVVDTGSLDNTVEIAKSYGAKVYEHPWENDFSLHRNQSISYATGDWVFIIDADEELVIEDKEALVKFLKKMSKQYDTMLLTVCDVQGGRVVMEFNSARIFRAGSIKYNNSVHNQPQTSGKAAMCNFAHIRHYGYDLSPEKKLKKKERILGMLYKRLEDDPNDFDAYFYLTECYAVNGDIDESIECGEKYIQNQDKANIKDTIFFTMARQYMRKDNPEKCIEWINMGLGHEPEDLDLNLALLEYGIWQKDAQLSCRGARQFIETFGKLEEDPSRKGKKFVFSLNPDALGFAFYWLSVLTLEESQKIYTQLMALLPHTSQAFQDTCRGDLEKALKVIGVNFETATE